MDGRKISIWLILVTLVIWIVWDVIAVTWGGPGATESEVIRDWSYDWKSIPYGLGILAGHWFWNVRDFIIGKSLRIVSMVLAWITIAGILAVDIIYSFEVYPLIMFATGLVVGRILWPMKVKSK